MQGTEKPDRELLDALGLCGALVREGSVYRFLAESRLRLFPDGMFADLFGSLGRPSQPASVVAVVLVLQALEGCSDREAAERLRCDVRWKAAAGLAVDDEGFHCSVLSLWRSRLRASGRPERFFDAVRELAACCGALSGSRRRALDSTVLDDAVSAQDTVTMISSQIRRVRRLVGAAAALELAHDHDGRARPACDWSDAAERAWLVDELVTDALAVLDATEGLDLTDEQADAVGLLAVVAGSRWLPSSSVQVPWQSTAAGPIVGTVLRMDEFEVGHPWAPIADLIEADYAAASEELPALARTWAQVQETLDRLQVDEFNERLKREWAIETGIIERLYSLDRGTTEVLIKHGIDASLIASDATDQPPELVAGIIRDHAEAVDWLFDAVTNERRLSTSFMKQLHQFMTRKQVHATGIDMFGRKHEIELRHGEFKVRPNNPVRPDGKLHEYCPPEHVDAEMDRLIEMHREHASAGTAPDVSAAWLHHRFAQIHPFQDGNGRIARAIASLVLIGSGWFPLVVTRDERARYIGALEEADRGDLSLLIRLVAELQRKWFVRAITIAEDVRRESLHLEQMLDVIGDMFGAATAPAQSELRRAVETAEQVWDQCRARCNELKEQLERRLGVSNGRRVWCDYGEDQNTRRRTWNRYQVVETANRLDYFANTRVHHEWVRLGIQTENGRSEILTSFHGIGTEYRGLVGVSMCFYRRQQPEETEDDSEGTPPVPLQQQIIELQPVSEEVFQINYEEPFESVERRFHGWLERALVLALDQWRRGE